MSLHKEIAFETEICEHLATHGWLYAEKDAAVYDQARALFPADVLAWVETTQPDAWKKLVKNHGAQAGEMLLARLRDQLDARGTLDVLRHGVELMGLSKALRLAEFKPALAINADILARYAANRLRVVRQVRYSLHNENCIDLVLFLNGIPVATVELKTDFTQSVADAVDQYRFDRQPRPKGQVAAEGLLSFPRGALVHFAVSNKEVQMTTRLEGAATVFLPFNQGDGGAAGNPVNPQGGHRTAYLWETVWARESWLEILGRYLVAQRDKKKQLVGMVFPRFHQLDVTRKLQAAVTMQGAGGKYLVQHSAGSGKTNSIAWTAHFLADLHDAADKKVFDSVLVVSDRNVIDSQLQEAIFGFERTTGVVATIKGDGGSKSAELAAALSGTKKIVVCTIQTFPFALEEVRRLAATQGKRFAVIADEAHSSQSGEAAVQAQGGALARRRSRNWPKAARSVRKTFSPRRWRRGPARAASPTWRSPPRPRPRRWNSSARGPTRRSRRRRPTCPRPSTCTPCGRPSRKVHPRRAAKLHELPAGVPAGAQRGGLRREADRAQHGHEGHHGLGAPAPLQHRAEGGDRGRTLPREGRPAAGRQGEGDGRHRQPGGGGALAIGHRQVHQGTRLQAAARWWRSRAR